MPFRKAMLIIAPMLAAWLSLCGCSRMDGTPAPTAVPAETQIEITVAETPTPVSSLAENRTINTAVTLQDERLNSTANGRPLLHIQSGGDLSASGLMIDHAAGSTIPTLPANQQAAILLETNGNANLSACTLASSANDIPLLAAVGGTITLSDTMAVHTGMNADTLLAANGGSIQATRCDLIAGSSGSACLTAEANGTIVCTVGTRITAATDGSSLAIRLLGNGAVTLSDSTIQGDVFLTGSNNALHCTNTQFVGNLRFENAEDEIDLRFLSGSRFVGTTDGDGAIGIRITLDATSTWQLTGDAYVAALSNEDTTLSNIISGGFSLYYNAESEENLWLGGKSLALNGGGYLIPLI